MKLSDLSEPAQEGLRKFWADTHGGVGLGHAIASSPGEWAWVCFLLRAAVDNPEWFPHGKWATIQTIESRLLEEAREMLHGAKGKTAPRDIEIKI